MQKQDLDVVHYIIFCPHGWAFNSWKGEALHQLGGALQQLNCKASMWYTDNNYNNFYNSKTIYQQKYGVSSASAYRLEDIDTPNHVWVFPDEYKPSFYKESRLCKRVLWWLTVPQFKEKTINPLSTKLEDYIFLTQSHYGKTLLRDARVKPLVLQLTNYVDPYYICKPEEIEFEHRIKQVVFNNTESQNHIIALQNWMPDVRFIGVSGLPSPTLKDLGLKSCVYLDFGYQDSFSPWLQITTALGCIPLLQRCQVASSYTDVPLLHEYTFQQDPECGYDYEEIRNVIKRIFAKTERSFQDVAPLRSLVFDQQQKFYSSVQSLIDQLQ